VKRVAATAAVLALFAVLLTAASACGGVAGTYKTNVASAKDGSATQDEFLKLDASGKYSITQVLNNEVNGEQDTPLKMFIEAGTWTLDGDALTLKPTSNGDVAGELKGILGEDPMAATEGTLRGDTITIGDAKYVKQ
jgi:hypothetical protein